MNSVQARVVQAFRETIPEDRRIAGLSDDQIARMAFVSYRSSDRARGLRLTNFGLQFMLEMFTAVDIPLPENHKLQSREILYLDKRATMPYYLSDRRLVVFETELGVMLRLADGDIAMLIEVESGIGAV